jgi:hypothetical protein
METSDRGGVATQNCENARNTLSGFSPLLFSAFFSRSNGSDSLFSPSCSTDDWVAVLVRAAGEPDDVSDANHRIVCEIDL